MSELGLFRNAQVLPVTYHVLSISPGEGYAVIPDGNEKRHRHVELHYNEKIDRRIPCIGAKCPCQEKFWSAEPRTYLAAMVCKMNVQAGQYVLPANPFWVLNVVGITRHAAGMLKELDKHEAFCLYRKGGKKNGPICYHPVKLAHGLLKSCPEVCIEQTLKGMWGIRS